MKKFFILMIVVALLGLGIAFYSRTNLFQGSMFATDFEQEKIKEISSCEDLRQEILEYRKGGYDVPESLLQMANDFQCVAQ